MYHTQNHKNEPFSNSESQHLPGAHIPNKKNAGEQETDPFSDITKLREFLKQRNRLDEQQNKTTEWRSPILILAFPTPPFSLLLPSCLFPGALQQE